MWMLYSRTVEGELRMEWFEEEESEDNMSRYDGGETEIIGNIRPLELNISL